LSPKAVIEYNDIFAPRQEKLLDFVCKEGKISRVDYSHLGDSGRGAYTDLCRLVEVGIFMKERRGRHACYALDD
jgi:hypothetical protein